MRIDLEPGTEHLLPFAKKKLAQLKRDTPALRSKRIYVSSGEDILLQAGPVDLIRIRGGAAGIGWAQTLDFATGQSKTGVLAASCDHFSQTLKGSLSPEGWLGGGANFLDCDTDLFTGAYKSNTAAVWSVRRKAIYFVIPGTAVLMPSVLPSEDGKTIVTLTPIAFDDVAGFISQRAVHIHRPVTTTASDGTTRVDPASVFIGTIATGTGNDSIHAFPIVDRNLSQAVWWAFDQNFAAGFTGGDPVRTILRAHSLAFDTGTTTTVEVVFPADRELYTDTADDPYISDPAWFAQTLADITAVRPSNDNRPWWVRREVRRVFYWRGIEHPYFAVDMPLGAQVALWARDAIMRGSDEVFAPDDPTIAHVITPLDWGVHAAAGIAAFIYKKVPLVQDNAGPDLPDDDVYPLGTTHDVVLNGAPVYRQDQAAPLQYALVICEGDAVIYNAPSGSVCDVRIHTNGLAMLVGDGLGPAFILEKVGATWVRKALSIPIPPQGVFPIFVFSAYQPVSAEDGSFVEYVAGLFESEGAPVTAYKSSIAKASDGTWTLTETQQGTVFAPGKPVLGFFRAFRAFRPYLF